MMLSCNSEEFSFCRSEGIFGDYFVFWRLFFFFFLRKLDVDASFKVPLMGCVNFVQMIV